MIFVHRKTIAGNGGLASKKDLPILITIEDDDIDPVHINTPIQYRTGGHAHDVAGIYIKKCGRPTGSLQTIFPSNNPAPLL